MNVWNLLTSVGLIIAVWVRMEVKLAVVQRDVQWIRACLVQNGFPSPGNSG